jgi:hypothetical protein
LEPNASTIARTSTPSASEHVGHPHPDLALAPAEHEDVHRRLRGLNIGEDPREEIRALDQRVERRGRRPGELERRLARADAVAGSERAGGLLRPVGGHRVGPGRPARVALDRQDSAVHRREQPGGGEREDRRAPHDVLRYA